jgi:PhzF family phenazine biosynthesis protein
MSESQSIPIWQVDAFTDRPFAGNPAAVCLLDQEAVEVWMQNVAAEMNLAETSFVVPTGKANEFHLRWFTPTVEVDLCGHATLAAAHTLLEQGRASQKTPIRFQTKSGELTCERDGNMITLDFPATPPSESVDPKIANELLSTLHIQASFVARSRFDLFVVVDEPEMVIDLQPNFDRLGKIQTRGIIVTAKSSDSRSDFVSRFFAPRCGINEDPVTGSAHCCLAPYWSERFGREKLIGYQASRRGGFVRTQVAGDRVKLSGNAVTVFEGKLFFAP